MFVAFIIYLHPDLAISKRKIVRPFQPSKLFISRLVKISGRSVFWPILSSVNKAPTHEGVGLAAFGAEAVALGAAAGAAPLKFCTRVSSAASSAAVSLSKPAAFLCSALSVCVKLLARALVRAKQRQRKSVAADLMK